MLYILYFRSAAKAKEAEVVKEAQRELSAADVSANPTVSLSVQKKTPVKGTSSGKGLGIARENTIGKSEK